MKRLFKTLSYITSHPLNQQHKFRAITDFIRWQLGSRLIPGEVAFDWIDGTQLVVGSGEAGLTGNVYAGLHEFTEMAFLLHLLREDDLFLDIGANRGSYTVLASGVCRAQSIAFEPVNETYTKLRTNVSVNLLDSRVQTHNIGLADQAGTLCFTRSQDSMNHVVVDNGDASESTEVEVKTLDSVISERSPKLIKIDVEGYELAVFQGAREVLAKPSLEALIVELNDSTNRYGYDDGEIMALLCDHGFRPCEYSVFDRTLTLLSGKCKASSNTIFVRDIDATQQRLRSARRFTVRGREF